MATKSRHLKTPLQLWVADNRKRLGLAPKDLASMTGVTEDTARGWESRGKPSEDAIAILERRFGQPVPADTAQAVAGDNSALIRALEMQTAALTVLITRVDQLLGPTPVVPRKLTPEELEPVFAEVRSVMRAASEDAEVQLRAADARNRSGPPGPTREASPEPPAPRETTGSGGR